MLTLDRVQKAARQAYDEGRLLFQNGRVERCGYAVRMGDKDCVCAIGAALPPSFAERYPWANFANLQDLTSNRLVDCADFPEVSDIQRAHDDLCFSFEPPTKDEIDAFLALLEQ